MGLGEIQLFSLREWWAAGPYHAVYFLKQNKQVTEKQKAGVIW